MQNKPKDFRHWRQEAEELNQEAQQQGNPQPIPQVGTLRAKPLAKEVIQARLDKGWQESGG